MTQRPTNLRQRLVFGTGRLCSGPYAAQSRRMIERCLAAGILAFDTAPSYGMGAAEGLVGDVVGDLAGVAVHTKVGSLRPSYPALRGWAKGLRNLAPNLGAGARVDIGLTRHTGPSQGMDYSAAALRASLARSHDLLRRERIDLVLLHEAEPAEIEAQGWAVLSGELASGGIGALGFAHSGPAGNADPALAAQLAPWPQDFLGASDNRPRLFHSVLRGYREAAARDPAVAAAGAAIVARYGLGGERMAGEYVAALVLLAQVWPKAQLVFATTEPQRLAGLLALIDRVEQGGTGV